jgi:hypothetical protein
MARRQCSLRLEDVLRTIAELGGQYPDVIDLLRQVDYRHCLTAPVRFDANPVVVPAEVLAEEGKTPRLLRPEEDALADRRRDEAPRVEPEARPATHTVTAGPGTRE